MRPSLRLSTWAISALWVGMSFSYLYHWDLFFTADYALIGRITERWRVWGEVPYFVWKVGYQGLLLEAGLARILFKLFGTQVWTLHLTAGLFFLTLGWIWFRLLKSSDTSSQSDHASLWGVFFLAISTPFFYSKVLRTQPNYTEIYAIGFGLWILYRRLLEAKPSLPVVAAFGFGIGWGIYTYGQIYFFILAMVGDFLFRIRAFSTIDFKRGRILWLLSGTHAGLFLLGTLFGIQQLGPLKWSTAGVLQTAVALALLQIGLQSRAKILTWIQTHRRQLGLFGLTALIGIAPRLYYRWILHGPIASENTGLTFDHHRVVAALHYLYLGLREFLTAEGNPALVSSDTYTWNSWLMGLKMTVVLASTFYLWLRDRTLSRQDPGHWEKLRIFYLFPLIVIGIFLFAQASDYPTTYRYLTPLYFFCAWVLGRTVALWTNSHEFSYKKPSAKILEKIPVKHALVISIVLFFSIHSAYLHVRTWNRSNSGVFWNQLIATLKQEQITAGYADYWLAYPVAFLSHEQIVLTPTHSNYFEPDLDRARAAPRVAWVRPYQPTAPLVPGNSVTLYGKSYKVERQTLLPPFSSNPGAFHQDWEAERAILAQGVEVVVLRTEKN